MSIAGTPWKGVLTMLLLFFIAHAQANYIILPMDESQRNHLKAYGVAYWALQHEVEVTWLLILHDQICRRY